MITTLTLHSTSASAFRSLLASHRPVNLRPASHKGIGQGPRIPSTQCLGPHKTLEQALVVCCARRYEDVEAVGAYVLPEGSSEEQLVEESRFVGEVIRLWLDEEWTPLEVHARLGEATADAYLSIRKQGENEMGAILMNMGAALMSFDFHDTFTSSFEVANKVSEVVMMRNGCDVCCVADSDKERLQRVEAMLSSGDF